MLKWSYDHTQYVYGSYDVENAILTPLLLIIHIIYDHQKWSSDPCEFM
jgi:hypothetical protein